MNVLSLQDGNYAAITSSRWPESWFWRLQFLLIDPMNGNVLDSATLGNDSLNLTLGWQGSAVLDTNLQRIILGVSGTSDYLNESLNPVIAEFNLNQLDSSRTVEFKKDSFNYFSQAKILNSGDLVFAGTDDIDAAPWQNMAITKTDAQFNVLWEKEFGSDHSDVGTSISPSHDGGFYLLGESRGYGPYQPNYSDALLIKTDSLGNELWRTHWGGYYGDCAWNVEPTPDGGVVVCGCLGNGENDEEISGYIRKMNANGQVIWEKMYPYKAPLDGGSPIVFNMCRVLENGYVVAVGSGYILTEDSTFFRTAPWLVILNNDGMELVNRVFISFIGLNSAAVFQDIRPTPDGGFIAGGTYYPRGDDTGNQDAFILKLDERGCEYPECMPPLAVTQPEHDAVPFSAYPNPFSDAIHFNTSGQQGLLEIYDMQGRLLTQFQTQTTGHTVFAATNLQPGVYVVVFTNKAMQRATGRVVKQ